VLKPSGYATAKQYIKWRELRRLSGGRVFLPARTKKENPSTEGFSAQPLTEA
jgi:hypothetical protein